MATELKQQQKILTFINTPAEQMQDEIRDLAKQGWWLTVATSTANGLTVLAFEKRLG